MNESVTILAIETSCDETSAAVLTDGQLRSNIIASQIEIHTLYGGVVPEIASRNHLMTVSEVVDESLNRAGVSLAELNAIAVTYGPGLVGALLIGVSYAKALAFASGIPLIGVNHLAGHISANFLAGAKPPFVCLIISGGHTSIVQVKDYTEFEVLGSTRDDAAGEAFDKVARVMGLGYPGGPKLDALAQQGNPHFIEFPRVMMEENHFDFSFSGLKSAVLNYINRETMKGNEIRKADLCASFRQCISDIVTEKTIRAAKELHIDTVCICGGVSCNSLIRSEFSRKCAQNGLNLIMPEPVLCSDNAGMIASAAYYQYKKDDFADLYLNAIPSLKLS
ncbi:MAG: tRNA (adenosine(37)-N6)-threonylcarbamoyltransferase complex transferase subunit TsaD [Anaerofustis sp.]